MSNKDRARKADHPVTAFPNHDIPGNMGQSSSALAESHADVDKEFVENSRKSKKKDGKGQRKS